MMEAADLRDGHDDAIAGRRDRTRNRRVFVESQVRARYEVLEQFHEEGESAKSTDRSQLQNLLTYCRLNKGRVHFVVVFKLRRFARDKYDHFALRSLLQSLGIALRSATEPIDDTGKRMEGVLAAFAQFDNYASPQMPLRKRATRPGFQVSLENDSAPFVGELDDDVEFPRPTVGGMRALPSIVRGRIHI